MNRYNTVLVMAAALLFAAQARAVPITLQNGSSTFTQGGFHPSQAVDGNLGGTSVVNGWAIENQRSYHVAVWETNIDVRSGPMVFNLIQNFGGTHLLGRFRVSVTTNARSLFADGVGNGGDVTAAWTVLSPVSITVPPEMTAAVNGDPDPNTSITYADSILTGGTIPAAAVYTVQYFAPFNGITGVRLEVIPHSSLPVGKGPGRSPDGNFVLQEIQLDAVPEPSAIGLIGLATIALLRRRAAPTHRQI